MEGYVCWINQHTKKKVCFFQSQLLHFWWPPPALHQSKMGAHSRSFRLSNPLLKTGEPSPSAKLFAPLF